MILETLSTFLTFAFLVLGCLFVIFVYIRHDEPDWSANKSAVGFMFAIVFFFLALLCAAIGGI
jgi:hypothetical protein